MGSQQGNSSISEQLISILREVKDPEIDVVDVVELGIVRAAEISGKKAIVTITPTYSGCPAMQVIETQIGEALAAHGFEPEVRTTFSPPWTTDWITDEAREKLRKYGIAPPSKRCGSGSSDASGEESANPKLVSIRPRTNGTPPSPRCPFCDSVAVELQSQFGSTACKALYTCHDCKQPFEHFKEF